MMKQIECIECKVIAEQLHKGLVAVTARLPYAMKREKNMWAVAQTIVM